MYFKELRNGKLKTIALNSKRARGAISNYIIKNDINTISGVKEFKGLDYAFDSHSSNDSELLFIKDV